VQGFQGAQGTQGATARALTGSAWVDLNAPAGGNGSIVTPFTTITAAIAALAGGGLIYLAAGTYTESFTVTAGTFYFVANMGAEGAITPVTLTGTISSALATVVFFQNCLIAGPVVMTGALYLVLASSSITSTGSVTNPSGGSAKVVAYSVAFAGGNTYASVISGPVTVRNIVVLQDVRVDANISCAILQANSTEFVNAHTLTTLNASPADSVQLRACCLGLVGWTYTGVATHNFRCEDDASALTVSQAGMTLTNATVFVLGTYNRQDETTSSGGGTATIYWKVAASATAGPRVQLLQLTAGATPCVVTFTDPLFDGELVLSVFQSPGGPYTVTWPASVHWPGGVAPTLTVTTFHRDTFIFRKVGAVYYGSVYGLDYA